MNTANRILIEQKFWDDYAAKYDRFIEKNARKTYQPLRKKLDRDTRQSSHMLELATGTGLLSISLCDNIPTITATDLSSGMITIAKQKAIELKIQNIFFQQEDICSLSFGDKVFDTILASNVLHLIMEPRLAIQEMKRVLTDEGRIILPTYCHGQSFKTRLVSKAMGIVGFRARNAWNIESFQHFLHDEGLYVTKVEVIKDLIPLAYVVATKKN